MLHFLLSAALAAPINPYLAASAYPLPHRSSAQQDATPTAGPLDRTRALRHDEIQYMHLGPGHFGAFISGPYPDGRRVIWSNGLNGVTKQDHDSFEVLAHLPNDNPQVFGEARADDSVAAFDASNDGFLALVHAFREARMFRDLAGVYTMVDRENRFYVGLKRGGLAVYGDKVEGDAKSAIELKASFALPAPVSGNLIGINMTYDGWIVLATEHGYVVVVSRDFKQSHFVKLRHSEQAAEGSTRPGYGWIRNSFAVDEQGGIYVASREHLHKVVWTGTRLSIDDADGAWTEPYANGTGEGSGSTPALMGFGTEDHLVAITDGDARMHLTLMWRDKIPAGSQRIAGKAAASMGSLNLDAVQSEQAVVVSGYGALVVNNAPRNAPWYLPSQAQALLISFLGSNPKHQPFGVQKFLWDPATHTLKTAWVNEKVSSPNGVPMMSVGSNRVYLVGARDNRWTLEALDWNTGASDFHYVIGGQRYNNLFSGVILDDAGHPVYGATWGRVRLRPQPQTGPSSRPQTAR